MKGHTWKNAMNKTVAVTAFCAILLNATFIAAQEDPEVKTQEVPIYIIVEPANMPPGAITERTSGAGEFTTVPGEQLKIRGVAIAAADKQLQITITPPQKPQLPDPTEAAGELPDGEKIKSTTVGATRAFPPTVLKVSVSRAGSFETFFTPQTFGEHEVVATDASGRIRGETRFEVENPDEVRDSLREEIEKEVKEILKNLREFMKPVRERIDELPASPAKTEAKQKAEELERAFNEIYPEGEVPAWLNAVDHLADLQRIAPATRNATANLAGGLRDWLSFARHSNKQAPRVRAELTSGNVLCDNLDTIINGLKFFDFMLGFLTKPINFFVDWGKENIPTKLISMIPAIGQTPAVKEGVESSWKGIVTFKPKREGGKWRSGIEGYERAAGIHKMAVDLTTYIASRVFEGYCQTFQGPVTGTMKAEFSKNGKTWWSYTIEMQGELVLRYPKSAQGDSIALTGEFMGNATKFSSWDNAVPVLFPELSQGTVFKTIRIEPFGMGDLPFLGDSKTMKNAKALGQPIPSMNPLTSVIEKGGQVARHRFTPAFFKVPVRGDLRGETVTIELGNAVVDFDDARVKVVQILLPVLAMRIFVNDYALPYKGARFMMFRAMDDTPAEFNVKRVGKTMVIERQFKRKKNGSESSGTYNLSIKACNPGCSGGEVNENSM